MKKKNLLRLCAAALSLLLLVPALSACAHRLTFKDLMITDRKTGSQYVYVPSAYQPKSVAVDPYASWKQNKVKVNYYAIEGLEPETWLVSEVGDVIYAGGETLPDLDGFGAKSAMVCYNTDVVVSISEITDPEILGKIVDAYMNGAQCNYNGYSESNAYSLRFESDKYPALYFCLLLIQEEEGTYLYNRYEGRYVNAGDLFADFVDPYAYVDDDEYME